LGWAFGPRNLMKNCQPSWRGHSCLPRRHSCRRLAPCLLRLLAGRFSPLSAALSQHRGWPFLRAYRCSWWWRSHFGLAGAFACHWRLAICASLRQPVVESLWWDRRFRLSSRLSSRLLAGAFACQRMARSHSRMPKAMMLEPDATATYCFLSNW
jgi:hypothetical protein